METPRILALDVGDRRITAILLMGPALDASYAAILPTATGLPTN